MINSNFCLETFLSNGQCTAQEISAVIAGIVALVALLVNIGVALYTLSINNKNTKKTLSHQSELAKLREAHENQLKDRDQQHTNEINTLNQQHAEKLKRADHANLLSIEEEKGKSAITLEERRRVLDLQTSLLKESIELQIKRLRDIRRACNQTLRDAVELKSLSPNLERNEMIVRSGSILRKAAIILAPADDKIPDLPDKCYAPLAIVRDALVQVILSWSAEKSERQPASRLHNEMLAAVSMMESAVNIFVPAAQAEEHNILTSIIALPQQSKQSD